MHERVTPMVLHPSILALLPLFMYSSKDAGRGPWRQPANWLQVACSSPLGFQARFSIGANGDTCLVLNSAAAKQAVSRSALKGPELYITRATAKPCEKTWWDISQLCHGQSFLLSFLHYVPLHYVPIVSIFAEQ